MKKQEVVVHLRDNAEISPVALLVQVSCQYRSEIHIEVDNSRNINAKSIMGVMTLDYRNGEAVCVTADGADEDEAIAGVCAFLSGRN